MGIKTFERKKEVKLRKNFLPTFIITVFLWISLIGIIYFVDPYQRGAIYLFFTAFFSALFFTFSIIFINARRGLIVAAGISLFLLLKYFGVGNMLNFLLLTGICTAIEIYLSRKSG